MRVVLACVVLAALRRQARSAAAEAAEHRADRRQVRAPAARRHDRGVVPRRRLGHGRAREERARLQAAREGQLEARRRPAHPRPTTRARCARPASTGTYKVVISRSASTSPRSRTAATGARRWTARPGIASGRETHEITLKTGAPRRATRLVRMSRAARRHVVGNDVARCPVREPQPPTAGAPRARADERTTGMAPATDGACERGGASADRSDAAGSAQLVAVQHPSAIAAGAPVRSLARSPRCSALLGIGTIEIYSATAADALTHFHDAAHYLERQLMYVALGGLAMWLGARLRLPPAQGVDLSAARSSRCCSLGAALGMPARNGAKRWIPLGPLTFQPVEIAKLALVTYLACSLGRKADQVKTFTIGFVPHLVVCGMMMALLLKQPDLGSSVVLGATTLGMLFMAGTRVSYILFAVLGAAPVAYHLVVGTPWRMQRFLAYFNPDGVREQGGLPVHPGAPRDRLGRADRRGPRRRPPDARLHARGAQRLHPRADRRGDGLDRRRARARAVRASWCGAASARRSARATCSAATSRSASR